MRMGEGKALCDAFNQRWREVQDLASSAQKLQSKCAKWERFNVTAKSRAHHALYASDKKYQSAYDEKDRAEKAQKKLVEDELSLNIEWGVNHTRCALFKEDDDTGEGKAGFQAAQWSTWNDEDTEAVGNDVGVYCRPLNSVEEDQFLRKVLGRSHSCYIEMAILVDQIPRPRPHDSADAAATDARFSLHRAVEAWLKDNSVIVRDHEPDGDDDDDEIAAADAAEDAAVKREREEGQPDDPALVNDKEEPTPPASDGDDDYTRGVDDMKEKTLPDESASDHESNSSDDNPHDEVQHLCGRHLHNAPDAVNHS
jgi:hypothetical protein